MTISIQKSEISGKLVPPSSKSVAHRALICAFISGKPCVFDGNFNVGDIKTTLKCLKNLGAKYAVSSNATQISYLGNEIVDHAEINVRDSGSTFRFLVAVVSALGIKTDFCGTERLANRPINELLDVLKQHGCVFSSNTLPFTVSGKLLGGQFKIKGNVSSQFITGLMLALPAIQGKHSIELIGEAVSQDYLKITESVMKSFGVTVEKVDNGFVLNNQKFVSPSKFTVEADWSSACFFLALGACCGDIKVCGLDRKSFQGDKTFLQVLKKMGANISLGENYVSVKKSKLQAIDFDAKNYPDTVPVLAAVAALCEGETTVYNVERLRQKESDRLSEIIKMLDAFGINSTYDETALKIVGGKPKACTYNSPNDHRMAMAATVLACATDGETIINNSECVEKSYPSFYEDLKKVGGITNV